MRDLGNWEDTMSKKDESLKQTSSIGRAMPPVRNSPSPADASDAAAAAAASKEKKGKGKVAPKPKAIPGGDFRAWDKFDVDAALDEMDAEDGQSAVYPSGYATITGSLPVWANAAGPTTTCEIPFTQRRCPSLSRLFNH